MAADEGARRGRADALAAAFRPLQVGIHGLLADRDNPENVAELPRQVRLARRAPRQRACLQLWRFQPKGMLVRAIHGEGLIVEETRHLWFVTSPHGVECRLEASYCSSW